MKNFSKWFSANPVKNMAYIMGGMLAVLLVANLLWF